MKKENTNLKISELNEEFQNTDYVDKKVYAEYVLIGTLASILMALIAASFISVLVH